MKLKTYLFLGLLIAFSMPGVFAQTRTALEEEAYSHLNSKNYAKAYVAFDQLYAKFPKELLYEYNLGTCCLHYPAKKARAVELFKDLKTKYPTLEVEVNLGLAYHINYKFDEAIAVMKPLVDLLSVSKKKEDLELLQEVKLTILNCENAKKVMANKVPCDIQNLGSSVNTFETEGAPIITADESMMIYTYVGEKSMGGKMNPKLEPDPTGIYTSDIFFTKKDSAAGKWSFPSPLTALNTKGNDAAIAISPDGLTLFTFKSDNVNEGDIYVSKRNGSEFSTPVALNANVNTPDEWEGSCSISADGKQLFFASSRVGGLGGRDLYVSELVNGDWGPAVNLGPKINTPYDDDAPFIHPDGITLFFSSKGHMSIGGYDIMYTVKEGNEWIEPKTMGVPINTVEDDSYYVLTSKGDKGYFSSGRDAKGAFGELDIYQVSPGILGEKPVLALLKGTVYGNDKPIAAKIEVTKIAKSESIGPYDSNSETGKYLMALRPGFVYRLVVKAEGFATVEEDFDIENLSTYMEKVKDFYMYAPSAQPLAVQEPAKVEPVVTEPAKVEPVVMEPAKEEPKKEEPVAVVEPVKEEPKKEVQVAVVEPVKEEPVMPTTQTPNVAPETTKQAVETPKPIEPVLVAKAEPKRKSEPKPKPEPKKKPEPKAKPEPVAKVEVSTACNSSVADLSSIKGQSLNDAAVYAKLMSLMGNYCADNIRFTVQIGAYKNPENFKYSKLKDLGQVSSTRYPDDITRFIQNEFTTIKAAEANRQKAIRRGVKDAWIIAFIDGKRYTLEELILVDFMGKAIN